MFACLGVVLDLVLKLALFHVLNLVVIKVSEGGSKQGRQERKAFPAASYK